ncbi:hypothetical protein HRbin28_02077 [bacterium HR28]|nr:hypothetical protein HRbin28_02077 [bacterium HR28]
MCRSLCAMLHSSQQKCSIGVLFGIDRVALHLAPRTRAFLSRGEVDLHIRVGLTVVGIGALEPKRPLEDGEWTVL